MRGRTDALPDALYLWADGLFVGSERTWEYVTPGSAAVTSSFALPSTTWFRRVVQLSATPQIYSVYVMSYGYSSGFPRVPNSTPQLPVSIRPPIHNPYDKFTQPQFDEWIGDITSALRKALGKDEEETLTSQPTKPREVDAHSASDTDNDNVEDSFAEWKAMRAKEKGKMRATEDEKDSEYGAQDIYEDSGLHHHAAGNTLEDAIELLSDDDDAEGDQLNAHRAYDDKDHNSGSIERPNSVEEEVEHLCVEGSQPAMPSKPYVPANATGHQGS